MQPSSHNRPGTRGDPAQESSVVEALAGAGQAITPGRSIKRTLQLRKRYPLVPELWEYRGRRAAANLAKAEPATKTWSKAVAGTTGVRTTAWVKGLAE